MKIAQIAPPWLTIPPKNYGGTEMVIYNLVEALIAQGHEVTLFAPGDAKTSARHVSFFPIPLLEQGVPWQAHLMAYYHLQCSIEEIAAQDFDIVHTHLSSTGDLYTMPLTAHLATPHVTTLHSHFPFDVMSGGWTGDADVYYIKKWADSVPLIAISKSACREALRAYPLNFVGVVHHGILLKQFQTTTKQPQDHFAWLGHFSPHKGAHLAIEAAKRANVSLVLAGTIDRHNQQSMSYFHDEIKPQVDQKQIRYIGPVNMKQKMHLFSRARGFLNPIEWEEPFGMVMIEAMALGCPVISFARGAAPEIVVNGETGFLVSDLDEMVAYIPRIDEIKRETPRQHVEECFSAHTMAENYVKIYSKVIKMGQGEKGDQLVRYAKP